MDTEKPVMRKDLEARPKLDTRYPRNRDIMLRFLEGQDPKEIAAYYELHPQTIHNILSSPLIQQELFTITSKADEKIRDRIARLGTEALDTVRDVMRGKTKLPELHPMDVPVSTELRLKAALEVLERHPELEKKSSSAEEAAQGLGEAIIRELARRAAGAAGRNIEAPTDGTIPNIPDPR